MALNAYRSNKDKFARVWHALCSAWYILQSLYFCFPDLLLYMHRWYELVFVHVCVSICMESAVWIELTSINLYF